jgi:Na+/proline symporter
MQTISAQPGYTDVQRQFDAAWQRRELAARNINVARKEGDDRTLAGATSEYRAAQRSVDQARRKAIALYEKSAGANAFNDTNYVFLSFVTKYLPAGFVGLVIAVILTAAMSSSSGELNSLAAVSVMDLYRRYVRADASDRHYLIASRLFTALWGAWAVVFAQLGKHMGSLVEAVNYVGSFFYPVLLGAFVLAFFFRRVQGDAAFWAMLAGEAAILACFLFTHIAFLWYNVIGAVVVVITGIIISTIPVRREVEVASRSRDMI